MEVTGKIKIINETQTFGANGFRKRELVLTTDEQYPQMLMIEFIQDKCDVLNNFQVGQDVKIYINLKGREWINPQGEAKYFNSIQGWKIENLVQDAPDSGSTAGFEPAPSDFGSNEPDDLPF
ncbi:DUF3127 domain-containing protein [Aureivirga sp. CE67]|uniref:DUF3127 domain-containing protein n=1 Tax=Aureivirga sp. CE67 TaxID=1788983 RepID=UPI0018C9349C|nr:DUF3127 domain-containing protein [Aureivirga sp. CE67]